MEFPLDREEQTRLKRQRTAIKIERSQILEIEAFDKKTAIDNYNVGTTMNILEHSLGSEHL